MKRWTVNSSKLENTKIVKINIFSIKYIGKEAVKNFGCTETDDTQVSCAPNGAGLGIPEVTVMHPATFKKLNDKHRRKMVFPQRFCSHEEEKHEDMTKIFKRRQEKIRKKPH